MTIALPARVPLLIFSPSGVVADRRVLARATKRLSKLGFDARLDEAADARHQRFAGDDEQRLTALHRVAQAGVDGEAAVAMATRGGYGLTRLLDRIDWPLIARSVDAGLQWVGYSDCTALQLAALAHGAGGAPMRAHAHHDHHGHDHPHDPVLPGGFWAGPMAADDFGRSDADGGLDDITAPCFEEAVTGQLEAVGFRTEAGFDGLDLKGRLWGGNLSVLLSLLGTPHWPKIKGGVLFLEDVNEHPYRVERGLLQLLQAGVLSSQKAVLLGDFSGWRKSPLDRGYGLKSVLDHLRAACGVPLLTGLPMGHGPTKVCLPQGRPVTLAVQGREAFIGW